MFQLSIIMLRIFTEMLFLFIFNILSVSCVHNRNSVRLCKKQTLLVSSFKKPRLVVTTRPTERINVADNDDLSLVAFNLVHNHLHSLSFSSLHASR